MTVSRREFVVRSGLTATALGLAGARPAAAAREAPAAAGFRPDDWASVRAQFRLDPDYAHLSQFFIVSHPTPVREASSATGRSSTRTRTCTSTRTCS